MMQYLPDMASIFAALGWSVIHFAWQGALVGLVAWMMLMATRQNSAAMRYAITCAAMVCCILAFIVTFILMLPRGLAAPAGLTNLDQIEMLFREPTTSSQLIDLVGWLWVAGVMVCSLRVAMQWLAVRRLKTVGATVPEPYWQQTFESLREEFGISRAVRMMRSTLAEAPMVAGWIAPVVLVPASAFTSLTPEQLRSILAHELSHIRRYDHLVNAAQIVVETILFFHPVVWWLSHQVRNERENCCDDAAVNAAGNPRILAEALAQLESLRITHPRAALAANGGPLMNRIARLLTKHTPVRSTSPHWSGVAILAAAAVMTAGGLAHATALGSLFDPPTEAEIDAYLETAIAKLQEGIDAGQITSEAASAKLHLLQAHLDHKIKSAGHHDIAGIISDAAPTMAVAQDVTTASVTGLGGAGTLGQLSRKDKDKIEAAAEDIQAAMESGIITPAEAREKLLALHLATGQIDSNDALVGQVTQDLHAAVMAGDLAPKIAKDRIDAIHELRTQQAALNDELDIMASNLHDALTSGKVTLQEAKPQLATLQALREQRVELANKLERVALELHAAALQDHVAASKLQLEKASLGRLELERAAIADRIAAQSPAMSSRGNTDPTAEKATIVDDAGASEDVEIENVGALGSVRSSRGPVDPSAQRARLDPRVAELELTAATRARDEKAQAAAEAEMTAATRARSAQAVLEVTMKNLLDYLRGEVRSGRMTIKQAQAVLDTLKAELGGPADQSTSGR